MSKNVKAIIFILPYQYGRSSKSGCFNTNLMRGGPIRKKQLQPAFCWVETFSTFYFEPPRIHKDWFPHVKAENCLRHIVRADQSSKFRFNSFNFALQWWRFEFMWAFFFFHYFLQRDETKINPRACLVHISHRNPSADSSLSFFSFFIDWPFPCCCCFVVHRTVRNVRHVIIKQVSRRSIVRMTTTTTENNEGREALWSGSGRPHRNNRWPMRLLCRPLKERGC